MFVSVTHCKRVCACVCVSRAQDRCKCRFLIGLNSIGTWSFHFAMNSQRDPLIRPSRGFSETTTVSPSSREGSSRQLPLSFRDPEARERTLNGANSVKASEPSPHQGPPGPVWVLFCQVSSAAVLPWAVWIRSNHKNKQTNKQKPQTGSTTTTVFTLGLISELDT